MKKALPVIFILLIAGAFLFYALNNRLPKYALGTDFTLKVGERVKVDNLSLNILEVLEDSRCPIDVECIWEGSVEVKILASTEELSEEIVIDWSSGGYIFNKYRIEILDVKPEQVSTAIITDDEYLLTLTINIENSEGLAGSISPSAVYYFTDALRRLVITKHGWPFYGFTPELFLDVLPGLIIEDFEGVEAEQGIYRVDERGELVFEIRKDIPTHASADAISNIGMKTLVQNLSVRKNIPVTDTQSVINLLKSLKI